jgi:hypothetical protein
VYRENILANRGFHDSGGFSGVGQWILKITDGILVYLSMKSANAVPMIPIATALLIRDISLSLRPSSADYAEK